MERNKKNTGRRSGKSDTYQIIIRTSQELFATNGYDRTTIRDIAEKADVDPALIMHYFKTKALLFQRTMFPEFDADAVLPNILQGDPSTMGLRIAEIFVSMFEDQTSKRLITGMIRAAASEEIAVEMLQAFVIDNLIHPLAQRIGTSAGELRATIIAAHLVGIVFARYIVRLEAISLATPQEIAQLLGQAIQIHFNLDEIQPSGL